MQVLKPSTVNQLIYILDAVTDFGTGEIIAEESITAGKSGTAETGRKRDGKRIHNGWFAGFFPVESAQAVVVVFVESNEIVSPASIFQEVVEVVAEYL